MLRVVLLMIGLAGPVLAQSGAVSLEAEVFVPPGAGAEAPVVLVLHGAGGTGPALRRRSGFDQIARAQGLVAVYPTAPGRRWNDGRQPDEPRDDVAALLALVARVVEGGVGDAGRLYVVGHSNGGGMAMRLACAVPERLAGIAVGAAKTLVGAPCARPNRPVPALFVHGTADAAAPHGGRRRDSADRRIAEIATRFGETLSAADTLSLWSRNNGCSGPPRVAVADPDPGDGVSLRVHDYRNCVAALRWIEVIGGGHSWPGAPPSQALQALFGPEPWVRDLDLGAAAVAFWGLGG
ncbi:MAG: alpha/beta fold hydrolase [Rhodobacteraceae bacterium]|nr:alpha/beta fold hydrolase [Paracoccaceae bacterium]